MMLDLQKASMWKRISAFLFDFIMLSSLVVGLGFILFSAFGFDGRMDALNAVYERYEQQYGVDFEISQEQFEKLSPAEQDNYNAAYEALNGDSEASETFGMVVNLTLLIISFSILIGFLILEFAIPLWLKNGQTMGKKIFGVGVMHTSGIQITPMLLFFRTVLGKYTIETMVPVLLIIMIFFNVIGLAGTVVLGLLLLLQIILVIATPTNSFLHDILAKTVAVDINSQRIFSNAAELIAYKEKLHAEEAARQKY